MVGKLRGNVIEMQTQILGAETELKRQDLERARVVRDRLLAVLQIVATILLVVVAVLIAAVTFGAGTGATVALAVAVVAAVINSVTSSLLAASVLSIVACIAAIVSAMVTLVTALPALLRACGLILDATGFSGAGSDVADAADAYEQWMKNNAWLTCLVMIVLIVCALVAAICGGGANILTWLCAAADGRAGLCIQVNR
jgi:hypothetical protein